MSKSKNIKVIIAGGGTGGHIFPAVAIAHAVKRLQPEASILFVGAKGKMEMEKVPKEGFEIVGLDIAGFDRGALWKNILLPIKLVRSFWQAKKILIQYKPDVAVGVGGYASFPILYMAQKKSIPTLLQEQNSFAGKSNKILGKRANLVCVAYQHMERFFPKEKIVYTGNPVRKNITDSQSSREDAHTFYGLNPAKKLVFAFGGSLGAKSINETLATQFKQLVESDVQLIWQTGKPFFEQAKQAVHGFETSIKVFDFIREMDMAYTAADVIISRAGASSISELCIIGKPVVFVPFPYASEDHQTHNAMALVNQQAAVMIPNNETDKELLSQTLKLLNDANLASSISSQILKLAITDADTRIANQLLNLAQK